MIFHKTKFGRYFQEGGGCIPEKTTSAHILLTLSPRLLVLVLPLGADDRQVPAGEQMTT